jgi:4-amino-4-deoxy-L-arabinose transferase-like glycosyltransferase
MSDRSKNNLILIFILIVATTLRCYNLFEIPFTHDEFSALFRTQYSSFSELLEKGIKPDGHPAGVQVFLYYYSRLFGKEEWIIKLPFIISGVAAVFMMYLIGRNWFGVTTGLICAAFMATLEYHVMYSQIARPYVSGLTACLFMVFFWHKVVFKPEKRFYQNLSFYIITSALCAYNHYFSLLFAIIVGFTGLFFIKKEKVLVYITAGILIFILFLPYFSVFLYQLSLKGVGGWLGAPDNSFLLEYLKYIFHFSWFVFFEVIAVILLGFFFRTRDFAFNKKYFWISAIWFILPFLTGFFYSKYVNPVLQESCLIFSFPFLLLAILSYTSNLSVLKNFIIVLVIIVINVSSLVFERRYYTLFYNSTYERIVENTHKVKNKYSSLTSIVDSHKRISRYYIHKHSLDSNFTWYDEFKDINDFIQFLQNQKTQYLSYGSISGEDRVVPFIIKDYYPYLIEQKNYYNGMFYLYSKMPGIKASSEGYTHAYGFEQASDNWNLNNNRIIKNNAFSGMYS